MGGAYLSLWIHELVCLVINTECTPCVAVRMHNILNQTYNTTRKWLDFCMNMWCGTIYLRHIAQLLTKNLWCTVSNASTVRFAEHYSD